MDFIEPVDGASSDEALTDEDLDYAAKCAGWNLFDLPDERALVRQYWSLLPVDPDELIGAEAMGIADQLLDMEDEWSPTERRNRARRYLARRRAKPAEDPPERSKRRVRMTAALAMEEAA